MTKCLIAFVLVALTCGCSEPPEAPPPKKEVEKVQPEPGPKDLAPAYRLLMASISPLGPEQSTVVLEAREGDKAKRTIGIGDSLDGYEVLGIAVGDGERSEVLVTFSHKGERHTVKFEE